MKVLQVHNRYQTSPGGEDVVVDLERELLRSRGHMVEQFIRNNANLETRGFKQSTIAGINSIWSPVAYRDIIVAVKDLKPDLVHVHNTFAALSPSIYWAIKRVGVPVVLTLHNYRITCATSVLLRDGNPCEKCVGQFPWHALRYRCRYHGSAAMGACIAATQVVHGWLGTYTRKIDAFIALSAFSRSIMIRAGLPDERVYIKPNFISDATLESPIPTDRDRQVVFVGQIGRVKGVDILLAAWLKVNPEGYKLILVGDGEERGELMQSVSNRQDVIWLGRQDRSQALREIARSRYLILPSRWYEGFPMVILEAMALATPTIVANHGSLPFIVTAGHDGMTFVPNDVESLAHTLRQALVQDTDSWQAYSRAARQTYLDKYTPEQNYRLLMAVYERAMRRDLRPEMPRSSNSPVERW